MNEQLPSTKQFLNELEELCVKWNKSIGHEDTQGAFTIQNYNKFNIAWIKDAVDKSYSDLDLDKS